MTTPQPQSARPAESGSPATNAQVIPLRPPSRWHDPLRLIHEQAPSEHGRLVLWVVSILVITLLVWAAFGQLDIIASADGKLVTQTLVKIVQPAEAGVVKQLLVDEGQAVKAGQVLARLDTTLAAADKASVTSDLALQQMQVRRLMAELTDLPMQPKAGDDPQRYAQVHSQYTAHRQAFFDSLEQEKSLLTKAEHEQKSAMEVLHKLEQTLPTYQRSAEAYAKLEKDGFIGGLAAAEKQRDAIEKAKDLDAQRATVSALNATIAAQRKKVSQSHSIYRSDLEKELAEVRARIDQLQPNLARTLYKEGLMELRAPQDGVIKDLATTTIGAVVQPGAVVMTLVPQGELLYADVNIKNEDVGFVQVGQSVQIKFAAYPFQRHGMLTGKVIHVSADATEAARQNSASNVNNNASDSSTPTTIATYKARVRLDAQALKGPHSNQLPLTPGMQVIAEINQGQRTVLEYLLSPVQKAASEAARER
jgi:hemolysin D